MRKILIPGFATLAIALLLCAESATAQGDPPPLAPRVSDRSPSEFSLIKQALETEFKDARSRPDYPMERDYTRGFRVPLVPVPVGSPPDSTPPSLPGSVTVVKESIFANVAYWTASTDAESGISYYTYAIGSQPGMGDIRWWQVVGTNTQSYSSSLAELGVAEDSVVYYSVMAHNGVGLSSDTASSGPVTMGWTDLASPGDSLVVELSTYGFDTNGTTLIAGWDSTDQFLMNHFMSRMKPIITEIYGPPSHAYTLTLVRNLWYGSSNIFLSGSNEVHMGAFYPQLLTHEIIHAYRDNVVLASDSLWRYHPHLSGFEESFAQGVSYACMNRYIELYPADIIVDSTYLYGSDYDWDYDFQNTPVVTTQDFWSDGAGTGIYWLRYEMGAAAMRKLHLEDPDFFKNWNAEYYARLNADHALVPTRDLMLSITAAVISQVEGKEIVQWLGEQRIFDCTIESRKKIWVRTQHYAGPDYWIFNRIFHYETFNNGSEWSYWDTLAGDWGYHSLNGSLGTATVTRYDGSQFWQGSQLIEPIDNTPVIFAFGESPRTFGTQSSVNPWPGGDPADFLLNMTDLNLYTLHIQFDTTETSVYRVIGNELNNSSGVWGGVIGSTGGWIYLDHDGFSPEPAIPVVNGAFWGTRQWASVVNSATGYQDSRPGKVSVRYVRPDGQAYLAQRNVDWGSWNGNQQFLFDTALMLLDSGTVVGVIDDDIRPQNFRVAQNYPNPFNASTIINFSISVPDVVEIRIYNLLGQRVRTLALGSFEPGSHKVTWHGRNESGSEVSSGVYFYVVSTPTARAVHKMVLLR